MLGIFFEKELEFSVCANGFSLYKRRASAKILGCTNEATVAQEKLFEQGKENRMSIFNDLLRDYDQTTVMAVRKVHIPCIVHYPFQAFHDLLPSHQAGATVTVAVVSGLIYCCAAGGGSQQVQILTF